MELNVIQNLQLFLEKKKKIDIDDRSCLRDLLCENIYNTGKTILSKINIGYDEKRINLTQPYYFILAGFIEYFNITNVIEIGTHKGGSGLAMMKSNNNLQLLTIDVEEHNMAIERLNKYKTCKRLIGDSLSTNIQQKVNEYFIKSGKTLLYIDALKDGKWIEKNIEFYKFIKPDYIIIDDITINKSMKKWWNIFSSKHKCINFVDYLGIKCRNISNLNCGFGLIFNDENNFEKNKDFISEIKHLSMLSKDALHNIKNTVLQTNHLNGNVLEFGCAKGGSAIVISKFKRKNKQLKLFDVFGQIPPPTDNDEKRALDRYKIIDQKKESPNYYGYHPDLINFIKEQMDRFNVNNNVSFIKGKYQDTLSESNNPISFAHIDCNWYESVKCVLIYVIPNLLVNGIVIIDDYNCWHGTNKAANEYFKNIKDQFEFYFINKKLHIKRIKTNKNE